MGLYVKLEDVKIRLIGKVRFTTDENNSNLMHEDLANRLINEAEGQVEQDLSPRYAAPFQTDGGGAFSELPERPTRNILRTLAELQAVMRILETDFGKSSSSNAGKYGEVIEKRYKEIVEKLLEKHKEGVGWKYPPLPSLCLNYMNTQADDGFQGMVFANSSQDGIGDYPQRRINSPAETFWNGDFDE